MKKILLLCINIGLISVCGFSQNVGIGIAAPLEKLHINGNLRFDGSIMPSGDAGSSGQLLTSQGAGLPPVWTNPGAASIEDLTLGSNLEYVSGTEYNGSAPRTLQLNGGAADKVTFWTSANTISYNNLFHWDNVSGYLGIGAEVPTQPLDVVGNVQFSGALMPNGDAGLVGQFLGSQGPGLPPVWKAATNDLYNQCYQVYGTLQHTISSTSWVTLTNLSIPLNLTGPAKIIIMTDGGIQTLSGATSGYSIVDIALFDNGTLFSNGAFKRISAMNNTGLVNCISFWSLGVIETYASAGAHTIEVKAKRSTIGSNAYVSGDNTSVMQGSLYVMVVYQ